MSIGSTVISGVGPVNAPFRKIGYEDTFQLVKYNGTTYFNKVACGTVMGKITSTGKVRPCAKTYAQGNTGVAYNVDDADNFYIGDTIDVISTLGVKGSVTIVADGGGNRIDLQSITADGLAHAIVLASPTLGVLGTVTINADGAGNEIDLVSEIADGLAHTITLVNPAGASDLIGASTIAAATGIESVVITLSHSGAALTATINQVIACINANSKCMRAYLHAGDNGAATAAAVGATPLAGGVAAPADKHLRGKSSLAAATDLETLTVSLGLNAAGTALASTVAEVITCINATSQKMEARLHTGDVGSSAAIAVGSTPLAGGLAAGGKLLTGATVTGVDKTASPNTITTASAITLVNDDVVQVTDGSATAIGILSEDYHTFTGDVDANGTAVHEDANVRIVREGVAIASALTGYAAELQGVDLKGLFIFE